MTAAFLDDSDYPENVARNVDPVNHYPRLWGWLCRGLFGLIQWCEEYAQAYMWGCPTDQFRAAAERINKFCDKCDEENLTGGSHIDYSVRRLALRKEQNK